MSKEMDLDIIKQNCQVSFIQYSFIQYVKFAISFYISSPFVCIYRFFFAFYVSIPHVSLFGFCYLGRKNNCRSNQQR